MNFLLIGGQPNTGKSETILRLANRLLINYTLSAGTIPLSVDFTIILLGIDKKGKKVTVLIHSATDDSSCINQLQKQISIYNPDVVISSIRDIGWERDKVLDIVSKNFSFEIPLAKITRTTYKSYSLSWYRPNIDRIIDLIISSAPFNL